MVDIILRKLFYYFNSNATLEELKIMEIRNGIIVTMEEFLC